MSSAFDKLISSDSRSMRSGITGTWLLFALAVAALDWRDAAPIHQAILAFGLIGFALAVVWLIRGGRWKYACLATSIVLLASYGVWWFVELLNHYRADPQSGLTGALALHVQIWASLLRKRFADGFGFGGAAEFYWLVGMPVIQVAVVAVMVRSLKTRKSIESVTQ
jgi:heme exporter protein D